MSSATTERLDLFLPEPEPREVRYTVISVDDHLVEPPHMFEGRLPAKLAGPGAHASSRRRAGPRGLGVRRPALHARSGMNAVAGRRPETMKLEPIRFDRDAPGLLRHRRPHPRHGHQRRVGVAQLPVDDHRLLRPGVLAGQGSRARPRRHQGVERLVLRGVVLAVSRSGSSRWASRSSPIRRSAPRRSAATPSAGFTVGHAARAPAPHRPPVALQRLLGPDHRGVRRDRHRHLPARRLVGHGSTCRRGLADAAARAPRCSASCRWPPAPNGCGRATRCKHPNLKIAMSEGGIGWVAMLLDRLDNIVDRSRLRPRRLRRPAARPRCCSATSGSAPSTTRRRSTPATASASTTSWSRPTTPTATAPGPTPRT